MKNLFLKKIANIALNLESNGFIKESSDVKRLLIKLSETTDPLYYTKQTETTGDDPVWLSENSVASPKATIAGFKKMMMDGMSKEEIEKSISAKISDEFLERYFRNLAKQLLPYEEQYPGYIKKTSEQMYANFNNEVKYELNLLNQVYPSLVRETDYIKEQTASKIPIYGFVKIAKEKLTKLLDQAEQEFSATGIGALLKKENVFGTWNEANSVINDLKNEMTTSNNTFEEKKLLKETFLNVKKVFDAIIDICEKVDSNAAQNFKTYSQNFAIEVDNYLNMNADYNEQFFKGMEEYRKQKGY